MGQARYNHTATLTPLGGGKVAVSGGDDIAYTGPRTDRVDIFDPIAGTFGAPR